MTTISEVIVEIGDDSQPLKHTRLLQLSGLDSDESAEFKSKWESVSQSRKRETIGSLAELAEDNLELDFAPIFLIGLEDRDDEVRTGSIAALWEYDDRSIIRPLVDLVTNDPSLEVRTAAATSLGKFAALAQEDKLTPRDSSRIKDGLLAVLDESGLAAEVRRRAIESVASFDDPRIDKIIRQAYESDDDRLKQSSIYAMGRSSNAGWLPIATQALEHESAAVRFEAAGALGLLGEANAARDLLALLDDLDPEVQNAAVQALGQIGGPVAKRGLEQLLESGDESLEAAAREALEDIHFGEDPMGLSLNE